MNVGVMIFSCCGFSGSINNLNNEAGATINGGNYGIEVNNTLSTLTNSGVISGNTFDIRNNSTISNLNNLQGAGSSALTYSGALPTNYNIIINSSSNFGQLAVSSGSGTMNFGIYTGSTVTPGTYSTVLSGISSGNLVTTSGSYNGLSWQLVAQSGSPTIWDLLFNPVPGASQPSFTTNAGTIASSTAVVLDGLSSTATDPGMIAAISSLQNMSASEQGNALRRIAPETNRSTEVASRQTLSSGLDTVSARIESVRGQGYVASLQDDLKQGKVKVASNGEMSGLLSADAAKNHSFWMKGFGAHGNQDQKSGFAGYNSKTWGTAFGADTLLENNWLVGAALTYARTDVDMTNFRDGDNSDIKTYQATAYTSHDFGKWYLDGMLSYAEQRFNSRRDTVITGIAKGNFDGHQVATRITAGMPFSLSAVTTLTPTIGLEWNRLKQDSYTETGAGALSMNVQGETANRVRSVIGARLATEMLSNGITIKPSLRASWRHDFNNDGIDSISTFTGGGASFKTPGQDLASNSYNVGATLAFQRSGNFIFSAHVDGEKASGYNAVSGQIMGQWLF
jgi:outer membrane autotransporter protein